MTEHAERSVVALDDSTRPIADPVNPRIDKAINESSPSSRAKHGHVFARLHVRAKLVQELAPLTDIWPHSELASPRR